MIKHSTLLPVLTYLSTFLCCKLPSLGLHWCNKLQHSLLPVIHTEIGRFGTWICTLSLTVKQKDMSEFVRGFGTPRIFMGMRSCFMSGGEVRKRGGGGTLGYKLCAFVSWGMQRRDWGSNEREVRDGGGEERKKKKPSAKPSSWTLNFTVVAAFLCLSFWCYLQSKGSKAWSVAWGSPKLLPCQPVIYAKVYAKREGVRQRYRQKKREREMQEGSSMECS